jgi:DNA-binding transcriptional MerR regulator
MKFKNLKQLADAADITLRMARYLVAEGFVPKPGGTKAQPAYESRHLDAIRQYLQLREQGLTQNLIRRAMQTVAGDDAPATVYRLAPGIDLIVTPSMLAPGTDHRAVIERIREILDAVAVEPAQQRTVIEKILANLATAEPSKENTHVAAKSHD